MIVSARLLADLKKQLKLLETDLQQQSDAGDVEWARALRSEFDEATSRGRTALTWSVWRKGELTQAAVAWIIATTFVRFSEDNDLFAGLRDGLGRTVAQPWLAGPNEKLSRAVENQTVFYSEHPTANTRDWLRNALAALADLPAGTALLDRHHNPVWRMLISAESAKSLLDFWRSTAADGTLNHDFTDANLDTRFLGDLYQDLSEYAKKAFALLQTPIFVEEFILDRTLTPAMEEFGLEGLKFIDPTCGSGHFLLGAFARLDEAWKEKAPALDARSRVQKALDSIYGVDLNPFAVAIARFRLTVAALQASGETSFVGAPAFGYHIAVGDSLLQSQASVVQLNVDDENAFDFADQDIREYHGILDPGQYHAVVGNPPYITVKDKALNEAYRREYPTCAGKYALSVPFMELFFRLAKKEVGGSGAGYVGKITSNSFMKREFGKKLIEQFLSGADSVRDNPVDLTQVVDTSGAYIPGHGTPTVILFARRRKPLGRTIRMVLGVRAEPAPSEDASKGRVWKEITSHIDSPGFHGAYVSVVDLDRGLLRSHPWSLSGGGASELKAHIESEKSHLETRLKAIGYSSITGDDEFLIGPTHLAARLGVDAVPYIIGESIRDYTYREEYVSLVPQTRDGQPMEPTPPLYKHLWRGRTVLRNRLYFGKRPSERGLRWFDYAIFFPERTASRVKIAYSNIATRNHFVVDRKQSVFNAHGHVIVLSDGTELEGLLGLLNSSTACFWLKQVSHNKGEGGGARVDAGYAAMGSEPWKDTYEFTGTKLRELPLPKMLPSALGRSMDETVIELQSHSPKVALKTSVLELGGISVKESLAAHSRDWEYARSRMVFLQEELDWKTYFLYGLIDEDLAYVGREQEGIEFGTRSFEIALAREMKFGTTESSWFERHESIANTELPLSWPASYRNVVERRLRALSENSEIALLESPEYKRRWFGPNWESQLGDSLREALLDRLEDPALWRDGHGPVTRSIAQLTDLLRNDQIVRLALESLTGSTDVNVLASLVALLAEQTVPFLAALRFKGSGLMNFREWQEVWELQRAEDAGQRVTIPIPPKYAPGDFAKVSYWRARGKLDVPKERFISYPGAVREGDTSPVLGWAGWDHAEQGLALSRLIGDQAALGADEVGLTPLLAGLIELEPWLKQWHSDIDPIRGVSPAAAITGLLEQQLLRLGITRAQANDWRATAQTRGRRRISSIPSIEENHE